MNEKQTQCRISIEFHLSKCEEIEWLSFRYIPKRISNRVGLLSYGDLFVLAASTSTYADLHSWNGINGSGNQFNISLKYPDGQENGSNAMGLR